MPDWWDNYAPAANAPMASGTVYTDPGTGQKATIQGGKPVLLGAQATSATDTDTMKKIHDAADAAESMAGAADQFRALNEQTATGPGRGATHIPILGNINPASQALSMDPNVKAMGALGTQMALSGRQPGMRTTQMEFQRFLGNAPDPTSWGTANEGAVQNADNLHIATGAKQAFYDSWLRNNATLNGAAQAWQHYRDTRLPQFYQGAARQTAPGGGQPAAAPPGGTPQPAPRPAPRTAAQTKGPTPTGADIQYLQWAAKNKPGDVALFDKQYGQGAAAKWLGGGGGQ